jgi:cysteine synthase A
VEAAQAVPGVRQVRVSKGPGTRIQAPRDAYDRLGHVIAAGPDRAAVAEAADRALAALRLVLEEELPSAAGGEA